MKRLGSIYSFEHSVIENETNCFIEYFDKQQTELHNLQLFYIKKLGDQLILNIPFDGTFELKYFNIMPSLIYESNFIWINTFLEKWIKIICVDYKKHNDKVKIFTVQNPNIGNFISYLKNEIKINWNNMDSDWNEIKIYREVRNRIVHHNNLLIGTKKEVKEFIENNHSIQCNNDLTMFSIIDKKILIKYCVQSKEFLLKLLDEVEKTIS